MSEKYFASRACARELLYALLYKKDFIALLEPDKTRGGLSHEMEVTGDEPAHARALLARWVQTESSARRTQHLQTDEFRHPPQRRRRLAADRRTPGDRVGRFWSHGTPPWVPLGPSFFTIEDVLNDEMLRKGQLLVNARVHQATTVPHTCPVLKSETIIIDFQGAGNERARGWL